MIMGRPIHDIDLTVDLPLGSVKFSRWLRSRHLTLGAPLVFQRYSTARLRLKAFPDDELEIVQTRSDKYGPHNADNPAAAFIGILPLRKSRYIPIPRREICKPDMAST